MKTFHKIFLFTLLIVCLSAACLGSHKSSRTSSKSHKWTHSKTHSRSGLSNNRNIGRNNLGNNVYRNNLGNNVNYNNLGNNVNYNNLGNNVYRNNLGNNINRNNNRLSKKSVNVSKQQSLKQNIKFSYLTTKKISFDLNKQFSNKASVNKSNFSRK
jgi:hypothetical protein